MDFQKLDPMLAAEFPGGTAGMPERELTVFVHLASSLSRDEAERLARQFGVERPPAGGVLTVTLPAGRVGELSEEPAVVAIRGAGRLRPLGGSD